MEFADYFLQDAPLGELDLSSSDLEEWNFGDGKHDNMAVSLGIKLWDNHGINLTMSLFMSEFNSYIGQLQRHAPDRIPVANNVAWSWPYPVGYFNNKGISYKPPKP